MTEYKSRVTSLQKAIAESCLTARPESRAARLFLTLRVQLFVEKPSPLRRPIMVAGLPDSGNVAKLVMDQLVRQLRPDKYADIYSSSMPPRVHILEDGTAEPMKHSLFVKADSGEGGVVLYTGDAQPNLPEAAYALADKALELAGSLGVELVITVGAYITGEFSQEPKVFGTATDKELLNEIQNWGVSLIDEGSITWMNGLLIGLSKLRNLKGVFLAGETSGYIVDARAARAVLRVLGQRLRMAVDLTELDAMVKQSEPLFKSIQQIQNRKSGEKGEMGYIG